MAKIIPYPFRLSCFIVGISMPGYPPLFMTIPLGIKGYLERGDFVVGVIVLVIWKSYCSVVTSKSRGEVW